MKLAEYSPTAVQKSMNNLMVNLESAAIMVNSTRKIEAARINGTDCMKIGLLSTKTQELEIPDA